MDPFAFCSSLTSLGRTAASVLDLPYSILSPFYTFLSSTQSILSPSHLSALDATYTFNPVSHSLAYKPVAKKVRPVLASLEEEYQVLRWLPDDPLAGLIPLPTHPLAFMPGKRFTQECANALDLDPTKWLWLEEVKLVWWMVLNHKTTFTWVPTECGHLDDRYFPLVKIPTVPHTPWILRNIPIPPSACDQAIQIIKDHIAFRVYKLSATAYQSRWFCVLKQDGKTPLARTQPSTSQHCHHLGLLSPPIRQAPH